MRTEKMKGRMRNFDIGDAGQERIQKKLESFGFTVEPESGNQHYDLMLRISNLTYAIECKSVRPYDQNNGSSRFGLVKLRRAQVNGLQLLALKDIKPALIVELRPRGKSGRAYVLVPWKPIWDKYLKSTPKYLTLSFWWILRNGVNLDWWLINFIEVTEVRNEND